jgi:hypothetical protein
VGAQGVLKIYFFLLSIGVLFLSPVAGRDYAKGLASSIGQKVHRHFIPRRGGGGWIFVKRRGSREKGGGVNKRRMLLSACRDSYNMHFVPRGGYRC